MSASPPTHTAFEGFRLLARGPLPEVALAVKQALDRRRNDPVPVSGDRTGRSTNPVLVFDDRTGRSIDLDTRGSDEAVVARMTALALPVAQVQASADDAAPSGEPRGRGRPKLGVVAREVTLLPRHWEWLNAQPSGASVALRKLVEEARRANADKDRRRQAQERAYHFMSAIGGHLPGFEEASRALFADDRARMAGLIEAWPPDVREHAMKLAFGDEPVVDKA